MKSLNVYCIHEYHLQEYLPAWGPRPFSSSCSVQPGGKDALYAYCKSQVPFCEFLSFHISVVHDWCSSCFLGHVWLSPYEPRIKWNVAWVETVLSAISPNKPSLFGNPNHICLSDVIDSQTMDLEVHRDAPSRPRWKHWGSYVREHFKHICLQTIETMLGSAERKTIRHDTPWHKHHGKTASCAAISLQFSEVLTSTPHLSLHGIDDGCCWPWAKAFFLTKMFRIVPSQHFWKNNGLSFLQNLISLSLSHTFFPHKRSCTSTRATRFPAKRTGAVDMAWQHHCWVVNCSTLAMYMHAHTHSHTDDINK